MRKGRFLSLAAAGAGATAAAVVTGLVAERRIVSTRKSGSVGGDELGSLHSPAVAIQAEGGVTLHAEVDEVSPYVGESADPAPVGPTIVFVHGYALNLDCWHFQRAAFRGKWRMVFYDQRSHGRSDRSARDDANIDQLGRDLRLVIDELAPAGPIVLVGHSMGGITIMALAEQHPELFGERVVAAALISTSAGGLRPHRIVGSFIPDVVGSTVTPRLVAGLARVPRLVETARRRSSNLGYLVTDTFAFGGRVPSSYVEFVDEMLAATPFQVLAEFFPHFETVDKFHVLRAFERIPTTLMCGTKDLLTSMEHTRMMAERLPGARLLEVHGAGHMVILERAERVNAAVEGLVAEALRATSSGKGRGGRQGATRAS